MSDGPTFDLAAGLEARDEGIARAGAAAGDSWQARALEAVRLCCRERPSWTTDDIWRRLAKPREPRAIAVVLKRAARAGWCEGTEDYKPTQQRQAHGRPCRVWRSLIYQGGAQA